jgi:hypothetical protein
MRSNFSSPTGSKRLPCLISMLEMPFSEAFSAARLRALALMSVARTDRLCRADMSAWMPQPVPRSRVRPASLRTVRYPSAREAGPMPSTKSSLMGSPVIWGQKSKATSIPS